MRILDHGIDTIHYHVKAPADQISEAIARCEDLVAQGDERVTLKGVNGYRYAVDAAPGLCILVPSEVGMHMGLFAIGGSTFCLSHEPQDYEPVIDGCAFSLLGLRLPMDAYRISRVDPRFDVADGRPEFSREELVSRAKRRDIHYDGQELTGATVGKGDILFRVYDKIREAKSKGLLDRWRAVWDDDAEEVWRYEYQLRGDVLKQFEVVSMSDLLAKMGDIMEYLFGWLRFAHELPRKDVDRPLLWWWQEFVNQVRSLPLGVMGAVRKLLPKKPNVKGLADQLVGVAASWAAAVAFHRGETGCDYSEVVNRLIVLVDKSRTKLEMGLGAKLNLYQREAFT